MGVFRFGGFQTNIDSLDYTFNEKLEKLYGVLEAQALKIPPEAKKSAYILAYYEHVSAFFDEMFGNGTSKKIFGDTVNIRVCDDAVYALYTAIMKEQKQYNENNKKRLKSLLRQANTAAGKKK